jgi:hypothetical protein
MQASPRTCAGIAGVTSKTDQDDLFLMQGE